MMRRTKWKMVCRATRSNARARHHRRKPNTRTHRIYDACRGSSVLKMRTQFSISRIGFGLTFRWIHNAHCTIIGFFHRQNVIFFFSMLLRFGCAMFTSSVWCRLCLEAKINDESMQLNYQQQQQQKKKKLATFGKCPFQMIDITNS